jgi:hypothetical protein
MEDNHYVIMDKYPNNQLIARIQMTSNKMFPFTLKPTMNRNTTQAVGKAKYVQLETTFTTKSGHSSNEENSACSIKKGECGTKMQATFQYEVHDDS